MARRSIKLLKWAEEIALEKSLEIQLADIESDLAQVMFKIGLEEKAGSHLRKSLELLGLSFENVENGLDLPIQPCDAKFQVLGKAFLLRGSWNLQNRQFNNVDSDLQKALGYFRHFYKSSNTSKVMIQRQFSDYFQIAKELDPSGKYSKGFRKEYDQLFSASNENGDFAPHTNPDIHTGSIIDSMEGKKISPILIVTVTKVEAKAILDTFTSKAGVSWKRIFVGNKTYYDLNSPYNVPVFMCQSEMGTSTPGGAIVTTQQAISDLHPQAIILCGIAFGLKPDKQKIGDILVAKQVLNYEPQKISSSKGWLLRGDCVTVSERLLDRFRSGDVDWIGAKTHFGLVLSGEKLVNNKIFRNKLLQLEPEAIGGEMEGAGLYVACRQEKVDWILVKAICDWADGNKTDEAQPEAASNAAGFVLHVLRQGGWDLAGK